MKRNNASSLLLLLAISCFGAVIASPVSEQQLLGSRQCTWGPSYWCSNLTNAKGCNAVRHCIQTVWERQDVPVDNDSICQICKDMVKQARDQLRSNETMEELKEVFEGSCNLIPIKVVKKECSKLADDFIPELVEALSSQMNPDQVCSVAGLCNNAEIDKLLLNYYTLALEGKLQDESTSSEENKAVAPVATNTDGVLKLSCGSCNHVSQLVVDKFAATDRDEVLEKILYLCGEMSSFSDACANIALMYFNDIYENLKSNLAAGGICHLSGVCAYKYHQHPEDVAAKEDELATLEAVNGGDDIPCELCQQLVQHLREVLIANTTEAEFKQVLEGLCKQTKGFKDECISIVDQYYDVIYHTLVNDLDANGACFMIGVCPKGKTSFAGDIMPLLPAFPPAEIKTTLRKKLGASEPKFTQEQIHDMTLPIDNLMGAANPGLLVESGKLCTICEYMLHFIQEELATPATEDEIKDAVNKICNKMPNSIHGQCHNFIDMYGDAVIALLIQGLNPREVCPKMQMCPANHEKRDDMEVFSPLSDETDKPTCPLCLFAVEQLQEQIKGDKSKQNIKMALDHLCVRLPTKLQVECKDFVETYSSELIDMLITDFTPQEICVTLKLCEKTNTSLEDMGITLGESAESSEERYELNEIDGSNEMAVQIAFGAHVDDTPNCLLCKELIKIAESKMGKHKSKEEIKQALEHSCEKLRKPLQAKCHQFVEKYGDKIADLLIMEMAPAVVCREIGLCLWSVKEMDFTLDESSESDEDSEFMPECEICKVLMKLVNKKVIHKGSADQIKRVLDHTCDKMMPHIRGKCHKLIVKHGDKIASFLMKNFATKQICRAVGLCAMEMSDEEDLEVDEALKYDVIVLPNVRVNVMKSDKLTLNETPNCILCEFIMTKLEAELKDRTTQDKIKHAIEHICDHMPNTVKKECNSFVDQYGSAIIALISTMKPNQICETMYMCMKPKLDMMQDAAMISVTNDVIECGVCHGATVSLLPYFKQHLDASGIAPQQMIDVACDNMPAKYHERCSRMIRIYGQSILHLSQENHVDEAHICAKIGHCFEHENADLAFVKISA